MTAMTMMMINLNMRKYDLISCSIAVADPGFVFQMGRRGCQSQKGVRKSIILQDFY